MCVLSPKTKKVELKKGEISGPTSLWIGTPVKHVLNFYFYQGIILEVNLHFKTLKNECLMYDFT